MVGEIGDELAPFGSPDRERYEHAIDVWARVIEPACHSVGLTAERSDRAQPPGEIPVQIFESLRDSDIVIADVSGANPNVMYELGLRHAGGHGCTLVMAEHQRLPFDIGGVRTLMYVRSEIGLIDARKRLEAQLAAAVGGQCGQTTAERVFRSKARERLSDAGQTAAGGPDEAEEAGFLDVLAEMEGAMPRLGEILNAIAQQMSDVTDVSEDATADIEQLHTEGRDTAQARLVIAARVAERISQAAGRTEDLVLEYSAAVGAVDRGMAYLFDRIEADDRLVAEAEEFLAAVVQLGAAARTSVRSGSSLVETVRELGAASRGLRSPTRRLAAALASLVAVHDTVASWGDRADNWKGIS